MNACRICGTPMTDAEPIYSTSNGYVYSERAEHCSPCGMTFAVGRAEFFHHLSDMRRAVDDRVPLPAAGVADTDPTTTPGT